MTGRGDRTSMPRAALPNDAGRTGAAIFWIAFGIAAITSITQVLFVVTAVPSMISLYEEGGVALPALLEALNALGPIWTVLLLSAFDFGLFGLAVWGSKRVWVGLLFVPPIVYLLVAFMLFMSLFAGPILNVALN